MQALDELNQEFRERYAINSDIAARAQAYELAARMQLAAPEVVDFSEEPEHVKELYGIGTEETDDFGRQLLLARRLAEKGVRFIQICHAGGGNGALGRARRHQDPRAALPRDRQADRRPDPRSEAARHARRNAGGLDQRVRPEPVVAEHHRPRSQSQGLHLLGSPAAASRAASIHGATDDVGYQAVEHRHYYSDLHATILHNSASTTRRWK